MADERVDAGAGKAKRGRARRALRWVVRVFATLIAAMIVLIIADSFHRRTCPEDDLLGEVIQVPGERLEIVQTGHQTNGQVLSFDTVLDPPKNPSRTLLPENGHVHPLQAESFEILEGSARILIGDREVVLTAGQTAVVPPNTVHAWIALGGEPVRVKAEFRPALDTGEWFYRVHGPLERGEMSLLHLMVVQSEFEGAPWPASPSPIVWKILVKILAPIGRIAGYRAC